MNAGLLIANLGAEEGEAARRAAAEPRVRALAALWREAFAPPVPFAWLALAAGEAAAWWNSEAAEAEAGAAGCRLAGAPPKVAARVHDKAFALRVARAAGLEPAELAGLAAVLEPAQLRDPAAAEAALAGALARWPAAYAAAWTLKPRLGSSGRGRVAGRGGSAGLAAVRGALARLAEHGGAILEPWLQRSADYSCQLHVAAGGAITLLGTLEQCLSGSGQLQGQRGWLDSRGRVRSGAADDETLREAAAEIVRAAAAEGYTGPCGVDSFRFATPAGARLRPVVELNARFTAGTVLLASLRRLLPAIRQHLALGVGEAAAFAWLLAAPMARLPRERVGVWARPLLPPSDDVAPLLVATREVDRVDEFLDAAGVARPAANAPPTEGSLLPSPDPSARRPS